MIPLSSFFPIFSILPRRPQIQVGQMLEGVPYLEGETGTLLGVLHILIILYNIQWEFKGYSRAQREKMGGGRMNSSILKKIRNVLFLFGLMFPFGSVSFVPSAQADLMGLSDIVQVSAGVGFGLALKKDGTV